jgi:hypothetical protein
VLGQEIPWLDDVVRAKRARRLPVVLTQTRLEPSSISSEASLGSWHSSCTARGCAFWSAPGSA